MLDIKTAVLENDKEYFIIDSVVVDNITYKLFSNVDDEMDIKIRKIINENDELYITGIEDDEEFNKVIIAFEEKLKVS